MKLYHAQRRCLGKKQPDEGQEKALLKIAVTYGTLRRLGFSESRVEDCLKAIDGVDLEEAYDWVCNTRTLLPLTNV